MTENQTIAKNLTVCRRFGAWWVDHLTPVDGLELPIGPYVTKAEAQAIREGLREFLRHGHKQGFVTTEVTR